jgi:hypothetical protein
VPVAPEIQCASYALELLSNGGLRSHVIAALVSHNSLELLYYDRSIVVKSTPLPFTQDTATFLAIIYGFANLTLPQWGYPSLLKGPTPPIHDQFWSMYTGSILELSDGWKLSLEDVIFRAHGVIGRGTVVVRAKVTHSPLPELIGKTVVVKWSWVPETRTPEADIVNNARQIATNNRPDMLHHLPKIYHHQEFSYLIPECQKNLANNLPDLYEKRVLRLIVLQELSPITALTDPEELAQAYKQIFDCMLPFTPQSRSYSV